jgi:hypothetical protein
MCESYIDKANSRKNGVSNETDIIPPEIYGNSKNIIFVSITFEKNNARESCVPTYFKDRYRINLCQNSNKYSEEFEKLIRSENIGTNAVAQIQNCCGQDYLPMKA